MSVNNRPKPWSFSALSSFETCPKKFWAEKVGRVVKEVHSPVADFGSAAHKHFEDRLLKGTPLPLDLRHHEKYLAKFASAKGTPHPEQKLALNARFEPTGFFDSDVYVRGIVDFMKTNPPHAVVVDWKFGKMKDGFDQLDLMWAMVASYMPEIESATGMFYWAKDKQITQKSYTRDDLPEIWNTFMPRVNRMQHAYQVDEWPARPNGLCRKWCGHTKCPHHG